MADLPYSHCKPGCRFVRDGACAYREMHVPTVAVDFDRVLFMHESWQGHENYGDPLPGVREGLLALRSMGFKIMIWTTRDQRDIIAAACNAHDLPFDYINENPNQPPEINPSKPVADYYIDDRAVRFVSWETTINEIRHRESHDPYYREGDPEPKGLIYSGAPWKIYRVSEIKFVVYKDSEIFCETFSDRRAYEIIGAIRFAANMRNAEEHDREVISGAHKKVLEVVTDLYDAGFKNPLVTSEAAIAYLERPTVPGHPEQQKMVLSKPEGE